MKDKEMNNKSEESDVKEDSTMNEQTLKLLAAKLHFDVNWNVGIYGLLKVERYYPKRLLEDEEHPDPYSLQLLDNLFEHWNDLSVDEIMDKVREEFDEMLYGTCYQDELPAIGETLVLPPADVFLGSHGYSGPEVHVMIGDSKEREMISLIICAMKWLYNVSDGRLTSHRIMETVASAHYEQYIKYQRRGEIE